MRSVAGYVGPGFDAVREAFAANFKRQGDRGAACCVYVDGQPVVDVWAGFADHAGGAAWQEDTIQVAGGSLAFANPVARMGFGYVTTRMKFDPSGDERTRQLVKAVYDSLH
jgi:CubicO group peptidase (beta-lactamase class C family)